jgi:hypothetical protein
VYIYIAAAVATKVPIEVIAEVIMAAIVTALLIIAIGCNWRIEDQEG